MDKFVFGTIQFENVFVNIDPFLGLQSDTEACKCLVLERFPNAVFRCPEEPGFCKAVQWLWTKATSPYLLHMEDDWVFHEEIKSDQIELLFADDVIKVALMNASFAWNGRDRFSIKRRRHKFLGVTYGTSVENRFGTSPGFWKADAVQKMAQMLNTELDPEKQMKPQNNPKLFDFISQYKCAYLIGEKRPNIISDIGRSWLDDQGVKKFVKNGKSWWEKA